MEASLDLAPDARVSGFTLAVSLLTGFLFAVAPAIQAVRTDVVGGLKTTTRWLSSGGIFTLRSALIVGQLSLALILLVGTGLLVQTLRGLRSHDVGFRRERVLTVDVFPHIYGYAPDRSQPFYHVLAQRARALPGVSSVSLAAVRPFHGVFSSHTLMVPGDTPNPCEPRQIALNWVTPAFCETLGIRVLTGRQPAEGETRIPRDWVCWLSRWRLRRHGVCRRTSNQGNRNPDGLRRESPGRDAGWFPARLASRVDPMEVLKEE